MDEGLALWEKKMIELTQEQLEAIQDWIYKNTSAFPGMTYADGMQAMLDVLKGDLTIEELLEE